jgi:hypothetical protein
VPDERTDRRRLAMLESDVNSIRTRDGAAMKVRPVNFNSDNVASASPEILAALHSGHIAARGGTHRVRPLRAPRGHRQQGAESGHRQMNRSGLRVVLGRSEAEALNSLIRPCEQRRCKSIGGADGLRVRPLFDHPYRQPAAA